MVANRTAKPLMIAIYPTVIVARKTATVTTAIFALMMFARVVFALIPTIQ
jgi:hypothetical protein